MAVFPRVPASDSPSPIAMGLGEERGWGEGRAPATRYLPLSARTVPGALWAAVGVRCAWGWVVRAEHLHRAKPTIRTHDPDDETRIPR
jgi:hypothetical protein